MSASLDTNPDRIRSALRFIPADDRDLWTRMLMALKSELGDAGRDIAETWSQTDPAYKAHDFTDVWRSVKPGGGINIGSLFHKARENGWHDDRPYTKPTLAQLAEHRKEAKRRADAEQAERLRKHKAAAKSALLIWSKARPVQGEHPYLVRKEVLPVPMLRELDASELAALAGYVPQSSGRPLTGRVLIVRIKVNDQLASLEFIDEHGRKSALAGGAKSDGYAPLQATPEGNGEGLTLLIGEGVASCMTATQATGCPAFAALSSGNLLSVAKQLRIDHPAANFVILAELLRASGEIDPHAIQAAEAIGARLVVPDFGEGRHQEQTDINDFSAKFGVQAVLELINSSTTNPKSTNFLGLDQKQVIPVILAETTPPKAFIGGLERVSPLPEKNGDTDVIPVIPSPKPETKSEKSAFQVTRSVKEKRDGVYHYGDDDEPTWICSVLEIGADTRDENGNSWGRELVFIDRDGTEHRWTMPMNMLKGSGEELRGELLSQGVEIANTNKARKLLMDYIVQTPAPQKARCVRKTGWYDNSAFVLPDRTIGCVKGGEQAEKILFQSQSVAVGMQQAGSLEAWSNQVSRPCIGNSRLVLAISTGFAALAMALVDAEGGGIHLRGPSSTGKSTAGDLCASIFSKPKSYIRSWRVTDNGLEGVCAAHNNLCLILDEIGSMEPKYAGGIAYMVANGQGKSRADRGGAAREAPTWQLIFLSSGELSLADLVSQSGGENKAGHSVRCIDLPSDAGKGFGLFECVPDGMQPSEFSDALKKAAASNHGHAMPAYVESLAKNFPALSRQFKAAQNAFVSKVARGASGQVQRVAARFGLIAAAGEFATEIGLTGWPVDESLKASKKCFADWLIGRGGAGDQEPMAMLSHVRAFLETHGDSRFTPWDTEGERVTINRAGYRRSNQGGGHTYYVLPETFKKELSRGFDCDQLSKLLIRIGALMPNSDGKSTRTELLPCGQRQRVYRITQAIWDCTL